MQARLQFQRLRIAKRDLKFLNSCCIAIFTCVLSNNSTVLRHERCVVLLFFTLLGVSQAQLLPNVLREANQAVTAALEHEEAGNHALAGLLLTWNIDELPSQRSTVECDCTIVCKREHMLSIWVKRAWPHVISFIAYCVFLFLQLAICMQKDLAIKTQPTVFHVGLRIHLRVKYQIVTKRWALGILKSTHQQLPTNYYDWIHMPAGFKSY